MDILLSTSIEEAKLRRVADGHAPIILVTSTSVFLDLSQMMAGSRVSKSDSLF